MNKKNAGRARKIALWSLENRKILDFGGDNLTLTFHLSGPTIRVQLEGRLFTDSFDLELTEEQLKEKLNGSLTTNRNM